MVQTRENFQLNDQGELDPVGTSTFSDAGPYNATSVPEQTYYVTAAWDDPDRVPFGYIVGNESSTEVGGVTYLNARLRPSTEYAIFFRIRLMSDTDEVSTYSAIGSKHKSKFTLHDVTMIYTHAAAAG